MHEYQLQINKPGSQTIRQNRKALQAHKDIKSLQHRANEICLPLKEVNEESTASLKQFSVEHKTGVMKGARKAGQRLAVPFNTSTGGTSPPPHGTSQPYRGQHGARLPPIPMGEAFHQQIVNSFIC